MTKFFIKSVLNYAVANGLGCKDRTRAVAVKGAFIPGK